MKELDKPCSKEVLTLHFVEDRPFLNLSGPDWRWDDQDGGEGHAGTVVDVSNSPLTAAGAGSGTGGGPSSGGAGIKTVVVQWDMGVRNNYRVGHHNAYDVRVVDSGPAGVKHEGVRCRYLASRWSHFSKGTSDSLQNSTEE